MCAQIVGPETPCVGLKKIVGMGIRRKNHRDKILLDSAFIGNILLFVCNISLDLLPIMNYTTSIGRGILWHIYQ